MPESRSLQVPKTVMWLDGAVDILVEPRRHVEGEPESDTIKSATILERNQHDTEVVVGAHSMNVNKTEEQHIDTSMMAFTAQHGRSGEHCY